jgi:hypothetical protein
MIGLLNAPIAGHATTFVQTSDGCTGTCGIDTNNTVTVTGSGGLFNVAVSLDTSWVFMTDPNGRGHEATFAFSDTSNSLTLGGISPTSFQALTTNPNGSLHMAPYTVPTSAYGLIDTVAANGKGGPSADSSLSFSVNTGNASETLTQFIASLNTITGSVDDAKFVADVFSGITGNTGNVDFSLSVANTPLPAALPLFAGGLGVMGAFGWRKRKAKSIAAAA